MRSLCTAAKSSLHSLQLEKPHAQQQKPKETKINKLIKKYLKAIYYKTLQTYATVERIGW